MPPAIITAKMSNTVRALQREMERRRENAIELEDDLGKFFEQCWPEIDPHPFSGGWHIDAITEHLTAVTDGVIRKLLINCPPRHSKSLLCSIAYPAWTWAQPYNPDYPLAGPQVKFLCLSFSNDLVMDLSTLSRRLLQSPWYQTRWGTRVQVTIDQDNKSKYDTTAGGSRISASFKGTITGRGGDIKIFDDPHNMGEVESETIRTQTVERYTGVLQSRITDPKHSAEIMVAQRGHERDLSATFLDDPDCVHLNLAAEFDSAMNRCRTVLGWEDPRTVDGELLWPNHFPRKEYDKYKKTPHIWAAQWQQAPKPRTGHIINPVWWWTWGKDQALADGLRWEDKPEKGDDDYVNCGCMVMMDKGCDRPSCPRRPPVRDFPPMSLLIGSLDTAYTESTQNDRSALTIWGMWLNRERLRKFMLVYAWAGRLEIHDLSVQVATLCDRYKVSRLLIESTAAGHPVEQEIRRIYTRKEWACELVPVGRLDKVARAYSVVQLFAEGMVYAPNTHWAQSVIDECASFPEGDHDDRADTVFQALKWLRDRGFAIRAEEQKADADDALVFKPKKQDPLFPGF